MVRGGAEGEVTALLAHLDGVVQPSVARVAVRGVVALLVRGAHPNPLHVLRRCLVGVPCAAVDEVAGASATLVLAGAVDADAMVGELIAVLAASAAAAESARPGRRADAFADVLADAASDASGNGDAAYVAAALVRGVGAVVAASMGGPGLVDPKEKQWAGPKHPLARALRAFPEATAAPVLDAVAAALGDGPDSAGALSRAPPRVAFARLKPFFKHALLSDAGSDSAEPFRQALHARLVRMACAGGPLAAPAASVVASCLPWYRRPRARERALARDAWLATACADVADAVECAFAEMTENDDEETRVLASASFRAAEACVALLAERRETLDKSGFCSGPGWTSACLGGARRLLAVAASLLFVRDGPRRDEDDANDSNLKACFASLACDVGALVPGAAARSAGEAAALVSLLARFFSVSPSRSEPEYDEPEKGEKEENKTASRKEKPGYLVRRNTAAAAVVAARVASALGLPPARGGRLAATLATPQTDAEKTNRREKQNGDARGKVADETRHKTEDTLPLPLTRTCASPDAALAHALEPMWHDDDDDEKKGGGVHVTQLLRALEADGAADDARVAAERRRRRARSRGAEEDSRDGFLAPPSVAPPTLPLVLLAHPSRAVREGAARAFAERIAAVPQRAPAALPALLSRLRADCAAAAADGGGRKGATLRSARAEAKALLAGLRAVAAGAAHPLGAPVALRALAPLVAPLEKATASADARETKTKTFFPGAPGVADPRSHALALRLLAELWKHHRGSFPRLKAALEHAVLSPSPEVRIGAAAACAFCAEADPYAATELAGPLRECLSPSAPPAAASLALEAVASLCEADALDFYAALKVVVTRPHLSTLPKHPLVASRWVALLGGGWLDAEARPEAAAAAVAAAFAATRAGLDADADTEVRFTPTRAAAFEALAKYAPATLLEPPPCGEDEEEGEAPAPGGAMAAALLREPSRFGRAVDAGVKLLRRVTRHEQSAFAARGASGGASGGAFSSAHGDGVFADTARTRGGASAFGKKNVAAEASVASLAARDPLLHRVMKATPRRLRSMPRLAGGPGDRDAAARGVGVGPAGAGAHLLLFRPAEALASAGEELLSGTAERSLRNASGLSVRAREALRDRADAHRRAFRTVAVSLPSPPTSWRWHVGLLHKSCARFARRWLDAELDARLGAAGAEDERNALAEARASVAETATELLNDAGTTPDAAQIAAAVLAAPALVSGDAATAERATDALLKRLTGSSARGETDGAERSVAVALGVVAGACHPGDRERRARAAAALRGLCASRASFDTSVRSDGTGDGDTKPETLGRSEPKRSPAAEPAAAAEALGMLARSLGASVAADGPGAGAWRLEMLAETVAFLRGAYVAFLSSDATGGFALGFVLAAVAADACARAGVSLGDESSVASRSFPFDERDDETSARRREEERVEKNSFANGDPTGYDSVSNALEALAVLLERGVDGADADAAVGASAAARAAPTAAAAALAAGAPCDALVLRALRAATRGAALGDDENENENENGNENGNENEDERNERRSRATFGSRDRDLRVACLASSGALLHVALSAGVGVPRADAAAAIAAAAAPLTAPGSGSKPGSLDEDAATHASGALGLAAALGGSWCLAGVGVAADAPNAGLAFLEKGQRKRGKEDKDASTSSKLFAPLLWGDEFGAAQARVALKTLEAAASAEGTAAAGGGSVALRARETAAWGLALAADAAVARAGAAAFGAGTAAEPYGQRVSGGSGAGTAGNAKNETRDKGLSAGSHHASAVGALADAILTEPFLLDAEPTDAQTPKRRVSAEACALAAARAMRVLAPLERLPAGDWPGALRRLKRRAAALEENGGETNLESADELRDACAAFAARHAGPGVGGAFLETALGDVSSCFSLPPNAVLERLGDCVAALPPSRAEEALARVAAAAAQAQARLPEMERAARLDASPGTAANAAKRDLRRALDALRATWRGILRAVDANASLDAYLRGRGDPSKISARKDARAAREKNDASRSSFFSAKPPDPGRVRAFVGNHPTHAFVGRKTENETATAGPWSLSSVAAAAASLAAALPRAAGEEMDLAVAGTRALFDAGVLSAPRAAARAADDAAPAAAAESFRARLVAYGALAATDATPLSAWTPREGFIDRFRCFMNDLDDDGDLDGAFGEGFFHTRRFATDAAAVGAEALAAATDSLWVIGQRVARAETKTAASDRARFPASAVAALARLDASGDAAAASAAAAAVFEAAANGGCGATAAAARALRHRVSDESWERLAWRLELR